MSKQDAKVKPQREKPSREIPMAQPDRSGPKGKSLMELAAERQAQLGGIDVRGLTPEHIDFPTQALGTDGPFATACLYSVTLSMVHFTLDVAVFHQYAQAIDWSAICWRFAQMLPAFGLIVYVMHLQPFKRLNTLRQAAFCGFACLAGAYLVRTGNTQTYLAVMERAPPLGALLIWSFVEMKITFALAALSVIALYTWWNGYSVA